MKRGGNISSKDNVEQADEAVKVTRKVLVDLEQPDMDVKNQVVFEFAIGGMTCVACSSTIERAMHSEFDSKSLLEFSIALLTHKMQMTFVQTALAEFAITPQVICDEIEMIGFECSVISITNVNAKAFKRSRQNVQGESDSELSTPTKRKSMKSIVSRSSCASIDNSAIEKKASAPQSEPIKMIEIVLNSKATHESQKKLEKITQEKPLNIDAQVLAQQQGVDSAYLLKGGAKLAIMFRPSLNSVRNLLQFVKENGYP